MIADNIKIVLFDAYNCKYMTETHSAYDDDSAIEFTLNLANLKST